jgi:hypothetical protein
MAHGNGHANLHRTDRPRACSDVHPGWKTLHRTWVEGPVGTRGPGKHGLLAAPPATGGTYLHWEIPQPQAPQPKTLTLY